MILRVDSDTEAEDLLGPREFSCRSLKAGAADWIKEMIMLVVFAAPTVAVVSCGLVFELLGGDRDTMMKSVEFQWALGIVYLLLVGTGYFWMKNRKPQQLAVHRDGVRFQNRVVKFTDIVDVERGLGSILHSRSRSGRRLAEVSLTIVTRTGRKLSLPCVLANFEPEDLRRFVRAVADRTRAAAEAAETS